MRLRALLLVVVAFLCWNADICDAGKKKKKKKPGSCLEHPFCTRLQPSGLARTASRTSGPRYRYERAQTIEEARALGARERDFEWRYEWQKRGPVHCFGTAKLETGHPTAKTRGGP